jgi:DNA processing protein
MVMDERRDWIALHRICWIQPQPAWELILRSDGVSNLLHLPRDSLCPVSDQDWSIIEQLRASLDWRQADRDLALIEKKRIRVVPRSDAAYPGLLKEIGDPPLLLFWRGGLSPHPNPLPQGEREHISIVGSRKATAYGRDVIDLIVPELVRAGVTVVSGLAFGIDAAAHRTCLAHHGTTIAVLASGIDDITPHSHQKLGELIIENGALCSEVPLGMPAHASHFLWRNRIISGMSRATLIVEAEIKSGSLVTAKHAADQGRTVFAVPGPITSALSSGCNQLLREGATPCIDASDILGGDKKDGHPSPLDATTARFLELASTGPHTMNQLGDRLQMPIAQILQLVTTLECAGMITVLPGGYISRK